MENSILINKIINKNKIILFKSFEIFSVSVLFLDELLNCINDLVTITERVIETLYDVNWINIRSETLIKILILIFLLKIIEVVFEKCWLSKIWNHYSFNYLNLNTLKNIAWKTSDGALCVSHLLRHWLKLF